jgi:hypothetical protein
LDEWFAKVKPILTPQENLLLKFLRLTGLRCSEGIESFNLIIELSEKGRLYEYLSAETGILEHFRYKGEFLRGTKNAFIRGGRLTLWKDSAQHIRQALFFSSDKGTQRTNFEGS